MKNLLILVTLLGTLVGCGDKTYHNPEKIVEKEVLVKQNFERIWFCENNSKLELFVDSLDRVGFESSGQSLNSINPESDTLGTHPVISDKHLVVVSGRVFLSKNITYISTTHDIEEDISGTDIVGSKRTDITLQITDDKKLHVKIEIFSNAINQNINAILATREWECE